MFQHVNPNKASGPGDIAPRVLKTCTEQLAHIFFFFFYVIFNECFSTNTVPAAWKTAGIVPVAERPVFLLSNESMLFS